MISRVLFAWLLHIVCVSAQFSTLPSDESIMEGGEATFTCNATSGGPVAWRLRQGSIIYAFVTANRTDIEGIDSAVLLNSLGSPLFLKGVNRSRNGTEVICVTQVNGLPTNQDEPFAILTLSYQPIYTLRESVSSILDLNESVNVRFTVDGNPAPQNPILTKDGDPVSSRRVTYSVNEVTITNLLCDDGGRYTLQSNNTAGVGEGNFVLTIANTTASIEDGVVINIENEETNVSFAEYVSGCPDNITITCEVPNMPDFTAVFDIGENTSVPLRRSQFISDTDAGEIVISCVASNAVGNSTMVDVTVRYDELPTMGAGPLSPGAIAGIAIGCAVFIIGVVLIIVGIGIFVYVKNKK